MQGWFPHPGVQRAIRAKQQEEAAGMRLAAVVNGPVTWPIIQEEVERRREVFARAWTTTRLAGNGETPLGAALESVYEDVVRGRL